MGFIALLGCLLSAASASGEPVVILSPSTDTAEPGTVVTVSVLVDMSGSDVALGAYSFELSWNTPDCTFRSVTGGSEPFSGLNWHLSTETPGRLLFNQYHVTGSTGTVTVARVSFEIIGTPGSVVTWDLAINSLIAPANDNFLNIKPSASVVPGQTSIPDNTSVTEAKPGAWRVRAWPNPFNLQTVITYDVSLPGTVRIDVYSLTGALVRSLVNGYHQPGTYDVVWNGRDSSGAALGSSVYFYCLTAGDVRVRGKLSLVK